MVHAVHYTLSPSYWWRFVHNFWPENGTFFCLFRQNRSCSANDSVYFYTLLRSVVRLSVCRLSHSRILLKPFDGFRCHWAGTRVGSNDTLC